MKLLSTALHFGILSLSMLLPIIPSQASSVPGWTWGHDGYPDVTTVGNSINHIGLISNNLTATKWFYGEVLGMRHIFTFEATENFTIVYMGYTNGGKNGTGFQTAKEMYREKNNREGLLEFVHIRTLPQVPSLQKVLNTFAHVGLIVPDLKATQERMDQMGIRILKRIEDPFIIPGSPESESELNSRHLMEARAAMSGNQGLGIPNSLNVLDPDCNELEIHQQDGM